MNKFKQCNHQSPTVNEGQVIVAYKKGSFGKVLGVYKSIREVLKREVVYNDKVHYTTINSHLLGKSKTIKLLHLQAVCVLRIKNKEA